MLKHTDTQDLECRTRHLPFFHPPPLENPKFFPQRYLFQKGHLSSPLDRRTQAVPELQLSQVEATCQSTETG